MKLWNRELDKELDPVAGAVLTDVNTSGEKIRRLVPEHGETLGCSKSLAFYSNYYERLYWQVMLYAGQHCSLESSFLLFSGQFAKELGKWKGDRPHRKHLHFT